MDVNGEPLERFYPRCAMCGEQITGKGYEFDGEYYCEDCFDFDQFDGTEVAEDRRQAAFENTQETFFNREE